MAFIQNYVKNRPAHAAFVSFCVFFLLSLPFNQKIFPKYFLEPSTKFDLGIYLNIAHRGYENASETAFYPLWPLIVGAVQSFISPNYHIQTGNLLSLAFFGLSLGLIWKVTRRVSNESAANWTVFLFALNPNSIFHALSYPESFFSILAAGFLLFTINFFSDRNLRHGLGVFITAALMGASRPILLQFVAAGIAALALTWLLFQKQQSAKRFLDQGIQWFCIASSGMILGYIPFGLHCLDRFNDFFAPFNAQKNWDRKFGFYWSLITNPKSVSSSDNMLTWDIQAFYLPSILLLIFLTWMTGSQRWKHNISTSNCAEPLRTFIILLCLLIAAAHSAIAFLTYPIFMSLARHVYSTPFFYVGAVGVLYSTMNPKWRLYLLRFYLFGSIVYLLNFWTRFGNSAWMG